MLYKYYLEKSQILKSKQKFKSGSWHFELISAANLIVPAKSARYFAIQIYGTP